MTRTGSTVKKQRVIKKKKILLFFQQITIPEDPM